MSKYFVLFLTVLWFYACHDRPVTIDYQTPAAETTHPGFVRGLEIAHCKKQFLQNEVVCFNLDLTYKGKKAFEGKIYSTTNSSSIRVEYANGKTHVFKEGKYFSNEDSTDLESIRFSVQTWQYFFMLPFKLSDPGTHWELLEDRNINGINYNRCKLTFDSEIGDTPDDWYVIHYNKESGLIHHVGYIVTGGNRSVEEAEKNARAISYSNYALIDSVRIAKTWTFSNYDMDSKITDTLGYATISNIFFLDNVDIFNIKEDPFFKEI